MSGILDALLGQGTAFTAAGRIAVRTEAGCYYGGETIIGNVYLEVKEPTQANSCILKVKGYEKSHFEVRTGSGDNERTERYDGKQEFFRTQIPLAQYAAKVNPGSYNFPFQFTLPNDLPSSFKFQRGADYARVVYKLKAVVDVPGLLKPNIKSTQEVVVRQRFNNLITAQRKEIEDDVRFFCCIPRGKIKIEMWVDKSAYVPGETANFYARIANKSSNDVREVKGALVRRVVLKSNCGREEKYDDHVAKVTADGSDILPGAGDKERAMPLTLPADLQPSVLGRFVKHEYSLDVEVDAGACTCDVTCQLPVIVYAPQPATWGTYWGAPSAAPAVQGPPMVVPMPTAPSAPPVYVPPAGGPGLAPGAPPAPGYPPAGAPPAGGPGVPPQPAYPAAGPPPGAQPGYPPAGPPPDAQPAYPQAGAPPGAQPGYPLAGAPPAYPPAGGPQPGYPAPGAPSAYPPAGGPQPGYPAPGAPQGYPVAQAAPAPGYPASTPPSFPPAQVAGGAPAGISAYPPGPTGYPGAPGGYPPAPGGYPPAPGGYPAAPAQGYPPAPAAGQPAAAYPPGPAPQYPPNPAEAYPSAPPANPPAGDGAAPRSRGLPAAALEAAAAAAAAPAAPAEAASTPSKGAPEPAIPGSPDSHGAPPEFMPPPHQ